MTDTLTALRVDYEALGKRIAELEKEQKGEPLQMIEDKDAWRLFLCGDCVGVFYKASKRLFINREYTKEDKSWPGFHVFDVRGGSSD